VSWFPNREAQTWPVTLIDSNVLLDVLTDDPKWADRSQTALAAARDTGQLVINLLM
jgi:hypothetical protein